MKPLTASPLTFLFLLWVFGAYALVALLLDWSGLSSHSNRFIESIASFIPSIHGYAELARNRDKAVLELCLAWLFSLAIPALTVPALDWDRVYAHTVRTGKQLRNGLFFLAAGALLLVLTLYSHPPSGSRRAARMILSFLQSDSAFIWGLALIMLAGFGWLMSIAGLIQLYKVFTKQGEAQ
jgi:hypothetical protein